MAFTAVNLFMNIRIPIIRVFFFVVMFLVVHEVLRFAFEPILFLFSDSLLMYGLHREFLFVPLSILVSVIASQNRKVVDYLMAVEAELGKISWANRNEILNCSVVVVLFITLFSIFLYVCDMVWGAILVIFGVLVA